MIKDEAWALSLRMLAQILIKLHVGASWGANDAQVLSLIKEADSLSKAIERGEHHAPPK